MIGLLPVSAAPLSTWPEVVAVAVYRANSDIVVAGWTAVPGGSVHAVIDEPVADDADFARSPQLGTGAPAVFGLGGTLPAGSWRIRVRARRAGTSGQARALLLNPSNVSQGASPWQPLSAAFATYELLITTTAPTDRLQLEVQA